MTDGVRRLSHEEAEMLISARMDELLDRTESRALLVHLQTCESCRAFAVQSEILGRELATLPVLPPSAIVDRQIRESISKGNRRWSIGGLFPATGGTGGLRTALGALAVLTLVSVYLLVRMAGDDSGTGPSIEAPQGGVAQQIETTATAELAMVQETTAAGPTETARVVAPPTKQAKATDTSETVQAASNPTEVASMPTEPAAAQTETSGSGGGDVQPTATLDSAFIYTIDKTKTPSSDSGDISPTESATEPTETSESGDVSIAAVGVEDGSPVSESETASATETPEATEAAATQTPQPTAESDTPEPAGPTEESAAATTPEPTLEPTMTPTPVEISVDATDEPQEPATQPPANDSTTDAGQMSSPEPSVESIEVPATPTVQQPQAGPTDEPPADTPEPTAIPETPFSQPTIAPVSGQSSQQPGDGSGEPDSSSPQGGPQVDGNDGGQSPSIVPSDGSDVEAAGSNGDGQGSSPQIVSSDATDVPDGVGSVSGAGDSTQEAGVGGETSPADTPTIPTVDDSVEPSGLDLSDTVTGLPSGTSSPLGRLEFSPGMNLYAVTAPDGQLAVADLNGELVVTLGDGVLPVWSGNAMMFSAPGDNGSVVGIWDSGSDNLSYVPASADEASSDIPIGGDGSSYYFLRTFPDRPGAMEIHSASIDGSDDGAIWSTDSANLGGDRPVWSSNGILLPTDSNWFLIGTDGSETELGANSYGYVGAPVVSPGEGLMAYSSGDQVIVAWSDDPGTAVATAPLGGATGGFAFSTSGEQIVVSDGMSLHVISYEGDDLGTLAGNQPIGAVYWISDTIYFLQIGQDAALKSTNLDTIQAE